MKMKFISYRLARYIFCLLLVFFSGCALQSQTPKGDGLRSDIKNENIVAMNGDGMGDPDEDAAKSKIEDETKKETENRPVCADNYAIGGDDISQFFTETTAGGPGKYTITTREFTPSDELFDEFIERHNICLTQDQMQKGIDAHDLLRIKSYALVLRISAGQQKRDIRPSVQKNDAHVFFVDPANMAFYVYPGLDPIHFSKKQFPKQYELSIFDGVTFYDYKNEVYLFDGKKLEHIPGMNTKELRLHADQHGGPDRTAYLADDNAVYFLDKQRIFHKIEGADPTSFRMVTTNFYADDASVYYFNPSQGRFHKIEGANPETFTLDWGDTWGDSFFEKLRTDKHNAFYYDYAPGSFRKIPGLDLQNVSFLSFDRYKSNVYSTDDAYYFFTDTTPLPVKIADRSDGELFHLPANPFFLKNDKHIFFLDEETYQIEKTNFDIGSFAIITMDWGIAVFKDKSGVYVSSDYVRPWKKIDLDAESIRLLVTAYEYMMVKDKDGVYFLREDGSMETLPVDKNSFTVLAEEYGFIVGKDKNGIYAGKNILEKVREADPETFEIVRGQTLWPYAKDKSHIYYAGRQDNRLQILKDADPDTFHIVGRFNTWYIYTADKEHIWFYDNNEDRVKFIEGAEPEDFDYEQHAREYFR